MNNNEITNQNFVDKVLEKVKHYDKEPLYWIHIEKQAPIEIYVNNVPVYKEYGDSQYGTEQDINQAILYSGKQEITYKLFSKEKEVYFGIDVYVMNKKTNSREKTVKQFEKTIKMPSNGVYEGSFTFDAEVPYRLEGWSKGQDLTKLNQDSLQAAVVAFYRRMWEIYADKTREEESLQPIFKSEAEIAQSKYRTHEEEKEILKELLLPYTNKTYEMLPLKDYKMVFYGSKMVGLEQTSMIPQLRGYSALGAKYKTEGGSTLGDMTQLILYLPEGKNLKDGLEVIR